MSFNKNNPNAMGKIMGYLKQLSTEMVSTFMIINCACISTLLTASASLLELSGVLESSRRLPAAYHPLIDFIRCLATSVPVATKRYRFHNSNVVYFKLELLICIVKDTYEVLNYLSLRRSLNQPEKISKPICVQLADFKDNYRIVTKYNCNCCNLYRASRARC